LTELLVVIAIIGILAALLMPALAGARAKSRSAVCLSNLKQWGLTWTLYSDDYNGKFSQDQGVKWVRGAWILTARNLIPTNSLLYSCPEATRTRYDPDDGREVEYGGPHQSYLHATGQRSSYGLNLWMYDIPPGIEQIQNRPRAFHWGSLSSVADPSRVPIFLDSMWRGGGPFDSDAPPQFNGEWLGFEAEMHHFAIDRHSGGVNCDFADGSVRKVRVRELWQLKWHREFNIEVSAAREWPQWMK